MGLMLVLGATLLWAVENVISKHVLKEISGNTVALGRMLFGSLFILAFLFATGKAPMITAITPVQAAWVLVTAALLLGYVTTWYNGLKQVKVSVAASILLLGSPITTLLNLAYGSPVSAQQWIGIALLSAGTFVAVYFVQLSLRLSPQRTHSAQ